MLIKGSITALVTPMKEDASIDYESLKNLINFQGTLVCQTVVEDLYSLI